MVRLSMQTFAEIRPMHANKVVLVTGASSGFGQAIAELLAKRGLVVFGTSRKPSASEATANVSMVPLDVRSDESVRTAVDAVLAKAGRIDVLVNNAGFVQAGAIEEVKLEQAKGQFETNFFGVVRMVKAVLPAMRKQGGGQIINIGSLAGIIAAPFIGFYNATKFALEGYTESLRHELKPFHIAVSLVEPGFFRTNIGRNRQMGAEPIQEYEVWRRRALNALAWFEDHGGPPSAVADAVLKIVESSAPRLRYPVGKDARRYSRLRRILPEGTFERGVRRAFRLDAER
ncbi:MAG: oxidoreductase [Thermoplasmata archaeon]|nr:oxidoreductase [Thermoplasmata archaeon]